MNGALYMLDEIEKKVLTKKIEVFDFLVNGLLNTPTIKTQMAAGSITKADMLEIISHAANGLVIGTDKDFYFAKQQKVIL